MENNRIYRRFGAELAAQFKAFGSSSPFEITVINVGAEGFCFLSKGKLSIHQDIELQVQLEREEWVTLKVEVIWVHEIKNMGYKVGVRIADATFADEARFIRFYCHQLLDLAESAKKILIIDDEKDLVKLLHLELGSLFYNVITAYDGEEGLAKYLEEKPDLIILDLNLPRLNGYEVCRKIRRELQDNETPILMITAAREEVNHEVEKIVGRVIGAQKLLVKPFNLEDLLHEVAELLRCKSDKEKVL